MSPGLRCPIRCRSVGNSSTPSSRPTSRRWNGCSWTRCASEPSSHARHARPRARGMRARCSKAGSATRTIGALSGRMSRPWPIASTSPTGLRVREDGAWYLVEQQLFALDQGGRLADVALVCSGFRRIDERSLAPDRDRGGDTVARQAGDGDSIRIAARIDAVGRSCATLTPEIGTAVRALEPGQVLEIVADDPTAGDDLRAWANLTGHHLIAVRPGPAPASRFFVRRSERRAAARNSTEGQV